MVRGSGNVFQDVGFPEAEARNLVLRSELMIRIEEFVKRSDLTQARAAARLGLTQPRLNALLRGKIDQFSLDALVNAAKENITGDPRKHMLTCGPAAPAQAGKVRVLITVSGDDPAGQRATEIRQAIGAIDGVEIVDASSAADRALHVVIQEQTLGKRTIGYTASYMTATPCTDESRKTDAELKGQLGTYTDPKGVDLATDLARMFRQDLQEAR